MTSSGAPSALNTRLFAIAPISQPELGGGGRGRRRALGQLPDLARHAQVAEHGCESREVNWHASRLAGPRAGRRNRPARDQDDPLTVSLNSLVSTVSRL